jgi:protein involved in polysaccharide export with SLBB domain
MLNKNKIITVFCIVGLMFSFLSAQVERIDFRKQQEESRQKRVTEKTLEEDAILRERIEAKKTLEKGLFELDAIEDWINPAEYYIGAGDILSINIVGGVNNYLEVLVSPEGIVDIPGHCSINVKDKTLAEVKYLILNSMKQFYKDAEISVNLVNIRPMRVFVTGEVYSPGACIAKPVDRLFDVIDRCGGVKRLALINEIEIYRDNDTLIIDGEDYFLNGNLDGNPRVKDGDIIFVPKSKPFDQTVTVQGGVLKPGLYPIYTGPTLSEFLTKYIDFSENVELDNIVVIRNKEYVFNESIYSENIQQEMSKFLLKSGDIVEIGLLSEVYVQGEVNVPGAYPFISNFKAIDYVGLAGGNTKFGSPKRIEVIHADGSKDEGLYVDISRGDVIIVPRSLSASIVGDLSTLEIISSLASILLTIDVLSERYSK